LKDCTIDINAEDLSVVIAHFQDQYDQIHLVGHSLGGPIILLAQIDNITSVALRDPSFNVLKNITEDLTFDERIDMYILGRGTNFLLMPEVIKSREKLTD